MILRLAALLAMSASLLQAGMASYSDQTSLGGSLYLVNRTYRLTQTYQPEDLTTPDVRKLNSGLKLREEAAGMLVELFKAAKEEGIALVAVSGYRSYGQQAAIFARKVQSTGSREKVQLLVAPPGASEHQLGLAVDIGRRESANLNGSFGKSREGIWLHANAHRFGFIIRYKAEWTGVTGYADEPWHIRYVGRGHAEEIFRRGVPLETYVESLANLEFGEYFADD